MPSVLVQCPNPACPARIVDGETVNRAYWEATWHEGRRYGDEPQPGEWGNDIACPACGQEGIDPDSGQLDSAEEELGRRCANCGVVSETDIFCPYCNWSKEPL
jgi:hypothetical protein